MHLHILGIGGTFMSALALLARQAGFIVTGSDANCYSPVSELLADEGIQWVEGYDDTTLALRSDCVLVGNAMKRGMPVIEALLNAGTPYTSGPQWLAQHILPRYRVMAVAGTHGKTTTTSMLAFILQNAGLNPGFLIGGVASDFKTSAALGKGEWFVIEADEYDSAFFDKRPKFIHYRPEVAILNNLEFDHADIYADLGAIQQQFHYFLKTIPSQGVVVKPREDTALNEVMARGVYSRVETLALTGTSDWKAEIKNASGSEFQVFHQGQVVAEVEWDLIGAFNVENALAAIAASWQAGVSPTLAAEALKKFTPVKRRLEVKGIRHQITVYDDFAHHPTAIAKTIHALQRSGRHRRIFVLLEFASYTMRSGVHVQQMTHALCEADGVYLLKPEAFSLDEIAKNWAFPCHIVANTTDLISTLIKDVTSGDGILVMSNRGFDNIHPKILAALNEKFNANHVPLIH